MNSNIVDLASSSKENNDDCKELQLQRLVQETLQKFDVNLEGNQREIKFLNFDISQYQQNYTKSVFGEKQSLSYMFNFVTYNVAYIVKLLVFQYDSKMEVLKVDIEPQNLDTKKELEYCCNYLKRRRNLNLMFGTLIHFSRLIEARRLICDLILKKSDNFVVDRNNEGGIIVMYSNPSSDIKIGVIWNIKCNSMQDITDVIEMYYKNIEGICNGETIKQKLITITQPNLSFTSKYHLWKELFQELSADNQKLRVNETRLSQNHSSRTEAVSQSEQSSIELMDTSEAEGIVLVSDSEDNVSNTSSQRALTNIESRLTSCPNSLGQFKAILCPPLFFLFPYSNSNACGGHRSVLPDELDVTPSKRSRKSTADDDLEITSVTYVLDD